MGLFINPVTFQNDSKGRTMPYASYDFYDTDTYDRKDTYSDIGLTSVNPNPVIADGAGKFPPIYLDDKNSYRVVFSELSRPDVYTQVWEKDGVTSGLDVVSGVTSIDSVAELYGLTGVDGQQVSVQSVIAGLNKGGDTWSWDSTFDKSLCEGYLKNDPSVTLANQGTGTGTGAWIKRSRSHATPEDFGVDRNETLANSTDYLSFLSSYQGIYAELPSNWSTGGGRNIIFNPSAINLSSTIKNSIIVLGGRNDSYKYTIGENAELAFAGGGGDTILDHLAGTICGGAHHVMEKNSSGDGSHGFIGGGSFNNNYGDYAVITGGTENTVWSTQGVIVGGLNNRIGVDGDRQIGRNSFIGGGWLNTIDGKYSYISSGYRCKAQKDYSGAKGNSAVSNLYGTEAQSGGTFSADGDNNSLRGKLRREISTGVATQLLLDGSSQALIMGANTVWAGRVIVSALRIDSGSDSAAYILDFSAQSDGASTVTIKSSSLTVLHEDDATWNVDVIASGSQVQVRGQVSASQTVRFSATFTIDEIRNI